VAGGPRGVCRESVVVSGKEVKAKYSLLAGREWRKVAR